MGILTREEKLYINPKTGKAEWITTKEGLLRESRTPVSDSLKPQIKAKQQMMNKARWEQHKKTYKKAVKGVNKVLDWIEGKPSTSAKKTSHSKGKQHYIIRNGVAYPVYKPRNNASRQHTSKKPKKMKDPFDLDIKF